MSEQDSSPDTAGSTSTEAAETADVTAAGLDSAVAEGGAYEIIRRRLTDQGERLENLARTLNADRQAEFGATDMAVVGRLRVRTEHNCVPCDIVRVGDALVFGYNVYIGLKRETHVEDVFSLYSLPSADGGEMAALPLTDSFLADPGFVKDFQELYTYYKHTRLNQLVVAGGKLLIGFQIGERTSDVRVFRFSISPDGTDVRYIDNRGERDIALPSPYDFEWTEAGRDDIVHGRHAHINVLDTVFVDTTGGMLTVKVENNTDSGRGIFEEPVEDASQSLDDADVSYARVGELVLLRVQPYREELARHLVFNTLTETVVRIDAIGHSAVQLPEDHGLVFPDGMILASGEHKTFGDDVAGMRFKRRIRSPNGEDVLFVFYEPVAGLVGLYAYNLIEKKLANPLFAHGYALLEDGQLVVFSAADEPTRIHNMQLWQTPYVTDEFASRQPPREGFHGRIGNAELVRGISELFSVTAAIRDQEVSARRFDALARHAARLFDAFHWLDADELADVAATLRDIEATAELVLDEFEKVQGIQLRAREALAAAERDQERLLLDVRPDTWEEPQPFVDALAGLRRQRGHLLTIRDYRYMDTARIDALEAELVAAQDTLGEQTVAFIADDAALAPFLARLDVLVSEVEAASTRATIDEPLAAMAAMSADLDLLSELMTTLAVEDATLRTSIIDRISAVYARLNQARATAGHKRRELGGAEARAQFAAQFKLFSQSITNALGLATTPERCDEQSSRLLVQLEELESQFSDHEEFLVDILTKREEVQDTFDTHRQQLLDERSRRARTLADAATRIVANIERRGARFTDVDELNTYFASDALVLKVAELADQLRALDDAVRADDIEARLKAAREQAVRGQRDRADLFEGGGNVIRLGPRHRFSVNTQDIDLTVLARGDALQLHISGTEFFEPLEDPALADSQAFWEQGLESETDAVYRAEFLADAILRAAAAGEDDLTEAHLAELAVDGDELLALVRRFAQPRYREGYETGIHDHDAARILAALVPARQRAGLLRYPPAARALAVVFYANTHRGTVQETWARRAQSAAHMAAVFGSRGALGLLVDEAGGLLARFVDEQGLDADVATRRQAGEYLIAELSAQRPAFVTSRYARQLADELRRNLEARSWDEYRASLEQLAGNAGARWRLSHAWLSALVSGRNLSELAPYVPEAVALINADERVSRVDSEADLELTVDGLLGEHPRIDGRNLHLRLDDFGARLAHHHDVVLPGYRAYQGARRDAAERARQELRIDELKARPLASFVRNRLINDSYLPIIGDNLAKQMGTVGADKRTDLMGLLMLISPPGYGKTTLMEYVASRLGLVFVKINCPSLGHDVRSLDSAQAPDATSRQELEKLNLALEMGSNVMLYLDDIQHTHPEFLQKFISLCDGTRRIEGVWRGRSRTYDMRGRKFCVVMAGNPYTESGDVFRIPDMLANRADVYNLGDVLGGMERQFALSYIENALTSNAVLAPLATRDMEDVYRLVALAEGREVASSDFTHSYSGAELNEIRGVLEKLFRVRDVVLRVNAQYIASAAQDDRYRTEPPFRLQGSYRNMNRMAEKVSAVMNDDELTQLLDDHYVGEAQLLTTGAEENLLKLAELRGTLTDDEAARWAEIKRNFVRNRSMGGDDSNVGQKVVAQLADISAALQNAGGASPADADTQWVAPLLQSVSSELNGIASALAGARVNVEVHNDPVPGVDRVLQTLADTLENSIYPLVRSMDGKLDIDLRTHRSLKDIAEDLRSLNERMTSITHISQSPAADAD